MAPVSALHIQAGLEQSDTFPPMAITAVRKTVTLWQAPVFLWTLSAIFVALIVLSSIIAIRKLRRSNREEESESSCFPCLSSACSNPNCDSAPLYTPLRRMANITVALLRGELGSPLAYRHLPSALRFSFSRSSDSCGICHEREGFGYYYRKVLKQKCGHGFHDDCMRLWKNGEFLYCPLCFVDMSFGSLSPAPCKRCSNVRRKENEKLSRSEKPYRPLRRWEDEDLYHRKEAVLRSLPDGLEDIDSDGTLPM